MPVLGQGFLHARCCATCVLVQTVFYTVAFPQLQFFTVFVVAFTLCSLSLSAGPCCQASTLLGPLLEVQFLDKLFSPVVVRRQVPFVSGCAAVARGDTIGRPDMRSTLASLAVVLGRYEICWLLCCLRFHFSCRFFEFVLYCDVVAIRSCVLCSRQLILSQSSLSLEVQDLAQTQCLSPS